MIYKAAMLTLAAAMTLTTVSAQEYVTTPVQISKEKVRIDGKVCYSHVVLEKQTLYSISKAYEVSIVEIYKYNPTLKETGLKKNSIIIIPSKEATAAAASAPAKAETKAATETKTAAPAANAAPASVRAGDAGALECYQHVLVCIARNIVFIAAHYHLQIKHLALCLLRIAR
jgi:hypothetical protein